MRKTVYTLNIGDYAPEICEITYPLLRHYAHRIGADFHVIKHRCFPKWPVTYEKLQIFRLGEERDDEWSIYIDSDALVHPETVDWTNFLPRDTVAHNGTDMAALRWRYDKYFLRDGRHLGSCNWLTIASSWCRDIWRPLEDLTFEQARDNIYPIVDEIVPWEHRDGKVVLMPQVVDRDHLIDDYTLSRNIARFGLKTESLMAMQKRIGLPEANFFWHDYVHDIPTKVIKMREVVAAWRTDIFLKRFD